MDSRLDAAGGSLGESVAGKSGVSAEYYRCGENGGMKSLLTAISVFVAMAVASAENTNNEGWAGAVPGYQIPLPQDHYPHYNFRTEWWYFTGNVKATNGRQFGYQLTFFR